MYVIFMALTPLARWIARRWSWKPVLFISLLVWAGAQCGLRAWVYQNVNIFGLKVPETSTGAFDLFGWQLLWMVGLALGTVYAESRLSSEVPDAARKNKLRIPSWLLIVSWSLAVVLVILRYSPADHWINPNVYGWLIDKWHLAPLRIVNFSALTVLLVQYGRRIAAIPLFTPLALLGRASIEVFSVHVLCCLGADALSHQADPALPWWQQCLVLVLTVAALFATARAAEIWKLRHHPEKAV
jgi:hypothetical protein